MAEKEMTKEEKLDQLEKLRQASIGVTGISSIAGLAGIKAQYLNKKNREYDNKPANRLAISHGLKDPHYLISDRTIKGLKTVGVVGIPVGTGLVAYSSYKKKKLKKDDNSED